MYKKKLICILIALILGICLIFWGISLLNHNKNYLIIIAIGCDASEYNQNGEIGYLNINYNNRNIAVKVEDVDLQNNLKESDLKNVIGVNLKLTIPWEIINEYHIDIENINPFEFLYNNVLDEFLIVQNVFYK